MHGIIFNLLYKFVQDNYDFQTLQAIKKEAGLEGQFHFATRTYPDEEAEAMLQGASKVLNLEREVILEAFGQHITPELLRVYKAFIKTHWDCMSVLENVEKTIHKAVMNNTPDTDPPKLKIRRIDKNQIHIEYTSPRKMIALGIGIIKKIAEHYQESLHIERVTIPEGTLLKITSK